MPLPTREDVHVDAILTNLSVAYAQMQNRFIASRAFPIVPVEKQSDKYFVWTKEDWFRDDMQRRGDSEESAGTGMNLSTDNYYADVWALHKDVGHLAMGNADLDMGMPTTRFLTGRALLRQEVQWVSDYFVSSVWATDVTPANLWSDPVNSDPFADVNLGKRTILQNTGFLPNKMILGYEVFEQLENHPSFIDRVKYTTSDIVTPQLLARLWDLDEVLVAQAVQNTASPGATASYAFTHGKNALLCYTADSPAMMEPSAGYIFAWTGGENEMAVSQGLGETIGVSSWFIREKKTQRYEVEIAFDDKVVGNDLGYFFSAVVA